MRQNPLSLLFVLLLVALAPTLVKAQLAEELVDNLSPDSATLLATEAERIDLLLEFGPHRNNPLAAGRNTVIYRCKAVAPLTPTREQLFGPAYKNKRSTVTADERVAPTRSAKRQQLTGPRYKNRSAKTGG